MLQTLRISNYAIIEKLDITFEHGFSAITGETGAGKSIILGALSLLMGKRADTSVLKNKESKSVVEAEFVVDSTKLRDFFRVHDLDFDTHIIIRREVLPYGKTRAFVNDTPVQLAILKHIGDALLDIHSQHHNLFVKESHFQLSVIDAYAENIPLLADYEKTFEEWREAEKKYQQFLEFRNKAQQDYDYFSFRLRELEQAKLEKGEQEKLEQELQFLEHGEDIKATLNETLYLFQHEDVDILSHIQKIEHNLHKHDSVSDEFAGFASRMSQVSIELSDLVYEMERYNNTIDFDPLYFESIQDRLNLIYSLQQKFNCSTIDELLQEQQKLTEYVSSVDASEIEENSIQQTVEKTYAIALEKAQQLTQRRKKAAKKIEPYVCSFLQSLGMPSVRFVIDIEPSKTLSRTGVDTIQMMFSANKNVPLQWLGNVASGGEISRIMLCLKTILAERGYVQTIIFDEIDTGVSGEIADKMGDVMAHMSQNMQVIAITHVPQIAAKALKQFRVFKKETSDSTFTNIILLSQDERITEIAKMISGKNITQAAVDNAKVLLRIL
ncbi:MAG: DNA repair protein RecN [Bacteroidales bacterium]